MDLFVQETNHYASQYITRQDLTPSAGTNAWKPTNKDELKVFLGLVLLTGLNHKKGSLASYWSKDKLIATSFFNKCMSRNQFQLLTGFLHSMIMNKCPRIVMISFRKSGQCILLWSLDGLNSTLWESTSQLTKVY